MFTPYLKYFIYKTVTSIEPDTTREIYVLLTGLDPMKYPADDDAFAEWKSRTLAEFEQMKEHHNAGGFIVDKVCICPENILAIIAETEARADFVRWV